MENNINKIDKLYSFEETVIKQIIKQDNEETKKAIIRYVQANYPNKNIRIDFLDEEKVKRIIDLGIQEYQKKENEEYKIKVLGQFDVEKNIDKDIKILEELAEDTIRYKMVETDAYMAGAITRVLSELSNLKWKNEIYVKSIKSHKETIEKKDIELEIWKKIAEKLAEVIERKFADKYSGIDVNKYKCKQSILDWARKEVEEDE